MVAMALRPLLVIVVLGFLAACADRSGDAPASDTLRMALPAAELPTFAKGDSYIFDNPRETWRVVDVSNDLVTWDSKRSGRQVTMFDPMLPPVRWTRPDGQTGERKLLEWSGSLFPLKAGNKLTFKTAVSVDGRPGHARFLWNCYVGNPRQVAVPAGNFAALPVFCRRNDGYKTNTYYAPALHRPIAVTTAGPTGKPVLRQLVSFEEGAGARIAASLRESLPGGWSAAAVANSGSKKLSGPRITPQALANDNPPVSLASPPAKAPLSPTQNTKKADRTRAAERNPARKATNPTQKTGFHVHIGSFGTRERAERGWTIFKHKFGEILENQPHSIALVDLGPTIGKTFRLYAGPMESAAAGKTLCRNLKKQGGYCRVFKIPTR